MLTSLERDAYFRGVSEVLMHHPAPCETYGVKYWKVRFQEVAVRFNGFGSESKNDIPKDMKFIVQ
jgi:hypothetical protein